MVFLSRDSIAPLFESAQRVSAARKPVAAAGVLQRTTSRRPVTMQNIEHLIAFLEVDADTMVSAEILSDLLVPRLDEIIEDFYDHVQKHDVNVPVPDDIIPRLKEKQKQHWLRLFKSQFGADYCASARRIGLRHRDLDLDPAWYVAGYVRLKLAYIEVILRSGFSPVTKGRLIMTLEKYIAIDMAVALSAFDAVVLA